MALADQLAMARDRALGELDAIEEYFRDAEQLWRISRVLAVAATRSGADLFGAALFGGPSPAASAVEQARPELLRLAAKSQSYAAGYLAEATFQQSLAVFEASFADLLTAWLTAYPDSLRKRQFEFGVVLDAADRGAAVAQVIGAEVGGLLYKSLAEQFAYLASRTGINPPSPETMSRLTEAKATRNVLVHNRGVVNSHYLTLAGAAARYGTGQRVEVPEPYRREVWELVRRLVTDLSDAALARLAPDLPPPAAAG